jgi:hypothetical protein
MARSCEDNCRDTYLRKFNQRWQEYENAVAECDTAPNPPACQQAALGALSQGMAEDEKWLQNCLLKCLSR